MSQDKIPTITELADPNLNPGHASLTGVPSNMKNMFPGSSMASVGVAMIGINEEQVPSNNVRINSFSPTKQFSR